MLQKKLWMHLTFPHWKLAYRTISSIVQLQAGILSPSYFKEIKEPGVFHETTGKEPPIFWLVIYFSNFWESWLYSRIEFIIWELQFINLQITLITARGSVPVSNNPLTLEIISNLCSKRQYTSRSPTQCVWTCSEPLLHPFLSLLATLIKNLTESTHPWMWVQNQLLLWKTPYPDAAEMIFLKDAITDARVKRMDITILTNAMYIDTMKNSYPLPAILIAHMVHS